MFEHPTHSWAVVNPSMGHFARDNPIRGFPMPTRLFQTFSKNLTNLMQKVGSPSSAPAVERASSSLGEKIGRSSVGRYSSGEGNPTLEQIETLAKVFKVDPWKMLHPALGSGAEAPTIAEHLQAIAAHLQNLSPEDQKEAADWLQRLALAPDGAAARKRLEELLSPALPAATAVSTHQFAGKPPSIEPVDTEKPDFLKP